MPLPLSNISLVLHIVELYKVELSYMYSFVTVLFAKYAEAVTRDSFIFSTEWNKYTSFHLSVFIFGWNWVRI